LLKIEKHITIAIVGLGYVGLPLAAAFGEKFKTIGFDIDSKRISELKKGHDKTLEVEDEILQRVLINDIKDLTINDKGLFVTDEINSIASANIYIVTVPTPTDKNNRPVLTPMLKASEMIGKILKKMM